jgi:hypothetical protein
MDIYNFYRCILHPVIDDNTFIFIAMKNENSLNKKLYHINAEGKIIKQVDLKK